MRVLAVLAVALLACSLATASVFEGFDDAADYRVGVPQLSRAQQRNGSTTICARNGRLHQLDYETTGHGDEFFIHLNQLEGLSSLACDVSGNRLMLTFHDGAALGNMINHVNFTQSFLTGTNQWTCTPTDPHAKPLIGRIMAAELVDETTVTVTIVAARYDELFSDLQVSMKAVGDCDYHQEQLKASNGMLGDHFEKDYCLGVNADGSCKNAASQIPLYSNGEISLVCEECFYGVSADVFFELNFHRWHLEHIAAGLKNVEADVGLVLNADFQARWSAGVDKQMFIVKPTTLVEFHIGAVPFKITFQAPLEVTADASFDSTANGVIGASAKWVIGDNYLQYNRHQGWSHVNFEPTFTWTPQLSSTAQFNAHAQLTLVPSMTLNIENIFTYTLKFEPHVDADVEASKDSKQLCAHMNYRLSATSEADMHLNMHLGIVHLHEDRTWGPTTLFDTGTKAIVDKCVAV